MVPDALPTDLRCANCDYALDRLDSDGVCPECGFAVTRSLALPPVLTRDALTLTRRVTMLMLGTEFAWLALVVVVRVDRSSAIHAVQFGATLLHLALLGAAGVVLAVHLVGAAQRREFGLTPTFLGIVLVVASLAAPAFGVTLFSDPMPIVAMFGSRVIIISRAITLSVCLFWLAERSAELRDGTAVAMRVAAFGHAILPLTCAVIVDDSSLASALAMLPIVCGMDALALVLGLGALSGFALTLHRRLADLDSATAEIEEIDKVDGIERTGGIDDSTPTQ